MARIGVLYDKDIKERVFGVFATNDSSGDYVLTLTALPTNIYNGQSSLITATLTDKGNPVQGREITFSIGATTVGTDTTDANGQATYTYQGTVAGTIQISALVDNVRGVINVVTTEISGVLWEDEATINDHASTWYNYQNILTVDYPAMYDATRVRKLEEDTNLRYYYYNDPAISETKISGYYSITTPSIIEFDVLSIVGTIFVSLYDGTNQVAPDISQRGHYKIINNGTTSELYKDDVKMGTYTLNGSNFRFGFGFNAQNEGIVFKNFIIYSLNSE